MKMEEADGLRLLEVSQRFVPGDCGWRWTEEHEFCWLAVINVIAVINEANSERRICTRPHAKRSGIMPPLPVG